MYMQIKSVYTKKQEVIDALGWQTKEEMEKWEIA